MIIDVTKLVKMHSKLENARDNLYISGNSRIREIVEDVIDDVIAWAGEETGTSAVRLAYKRLEKAAGLFDPSYADPAGCKEKILSVMHELEAIADENTEEGKEIYISHRMAGLIFNALSDDPGESLETIAADLFDGNREDAAGLVDLFRHDFTQALLEEIAYWDSEAEDLYHIWKYYNLCIPFLKEYANRTGYILRWKAYNEKKGLPIPEDDRTKWEDEDPAGAMPEGDAEAAENAAEGFVLYAMLGVTMKDENGEESKTIVTVPREAVPKDLKPGEELIFEFDGEEMPCVLLGIGGYDPEAVDGPPAPEEILKAFEETEGEE